MKPLIILFLLLTIGCSTHQTVLFEDHCQPVSNPDMGWNFAYFSNNTQMFGTTLKDGDTLDWFPNCDTVFFRLGWRHLEPEEGKFNWEFTDRIAREWVEKGKRAAFCWVVCYPGFQDTPLWVKDAGAKGVTYNVIEEGKKYGFNFKSPKWLTDLGGEFIDSWVPYYDDPVFLEKFGNFLAAAAERYDGQEWVEFIEIGSVGSWGEGHQHMSWPVPITAEIKKTHADLWHKHFPNTTVIVGDDYSKEIWEYVREKGLGLADHSVQVNGRSANKEMAEKFWRQAPVLLENHPGTMPGELYEQGLLDCHASHLRLHSNPYQAWNTSRDRIERMSLKVGYRFQCLETTFPETVEPGSIMAVEAVFKNAAVAPCYKDYFLTLWLVGDGGEFKWTNRDCNFREFMPDEEAKKVSNGWNLPADLPAGNYQLLLSVGDDEGTPLINLPILGTDQQKRLPLGSVQVK